MADYLRKSGGEPGLRSVMAEGDGLCDAAAIGDVERLCSLAKKGVDVNQADYDKRTAMCAPCGPDNTLIELRNARVGAADCLLP